MDLREKTVDSVSKGVSKSNTARRFGVDRSTVKHYVKQLDQSGSLAPKKTPGSRPMLDESAMRLRKEDVKARPWATHRQRSEFFAVVRGGYLADKGFSFLRRLLVEFAPVCFTAAGGHARTSLCNRG